MLNLSGISVNPTTENQDRCKDVGNEVGSDCPKRAPENHAHVSPESAKISLNSSKVVLGMLTAKDLGCRQTSISD